MAVVTCWLRWCLLMIHIFKAVSWCHVHLARVRILCAQPDAVCQQTVTKEGCKTLLRFLVCLTDCIRLASLNDLAPLQLQLCIH